MKKIRWTIPVLFCVFLMFAGSSCMPAAKPDLTLVFEARHVYSLDYDSLNQTIYLIWSEVPRGAQDSAQVITAYHLPSGQETVLMSDIPFLFKPWIAVGRMGEVYVLDNGRNITHDPSKESNVRSLLVFEDHALSRTHTIEYLTGEEPTPLPDEDININYLGMNRAEGNLFYPKFILIEKTEGQIQVYDPTYASMDWTNRSLEYYLENNLQNLNVTTFLDTNEQEKEVWVNRKMQFKYREQASLLLMFGNSPCERVYDLVRFQGIRYNMGQCIKGIHLFPTSGNFFTEDNRLIYVSSGGVYLLGS